MEQTAPEAPVTQTEPGSTASIPTDPYAIDETRFASLSPEQRASLDPVLNEWKDRAKGEVEKTRKAYEDKYKPDLEKAKALTELVQKPEFQQWWMQQQRAASQVNPQGAGEIGQTQPQDIASNEEWQNALSDAYAGDPTKMKMLQARMFSLMATPVVQQLREGQEELRTTMEMKNLFESHPDAKTLDKIGQDPNDADSPSLLEVALNLADARRQPLEWGYRLAKKWADSMNVNAKQEAMGLVQEKKQSITSGPSTNRAPGTQIVEVADSEELMSRSMSWTLDHPNQPAPRFVIRPPSQRTEQRWAQRT
jgi:hypothetical protein